VRILIAGAGIAGLTLSALLQRQGHDVTVVEKRREVDSDAGYGLALWPHGTRVLHAVGVYDDMVSRSAPMTRYTARDDRGRLLSSSRIPAEVERFGHLGLLGRGELVDLLRRAASGVDIRYDATVASVAQSPTDLAALLSDGRTERADVLVGADGIGSGVRKALLGQVPRFDTGWGCLVWWADASLAEQGETTERWGNGTFLGTYPCADRLCVIAGAPSARFASPYGRTDAAAAVLREHGLSDPRWQERLHDDLTLWPMADVRAPRWTAGRATLVGDAATAFLPTAGIGASMALESAAALADELSRADAASVPEALALYERRRRARTERAQTLSRRLARLTFVKSRPIAAVRDALLRRASVETLVGPLLRDLRRPL
jgi:2-polyprenyl-6-methoxyphenol hydroxylase-like FAD-dependent oxidoreductase